MGKMVTDLPRRLTLAYPEKLQENPEDTGTKQKISSQRARSTLTSCPNKCIHVSTALD
jgi:hypothetical protein